MHSLTQRCPLSHTVVAAAQQTLAELVEGELEQRLSKPLLSWWKESVPGERDPDSATLAELVEGVVERHSQAVLTVRLERAYSAIHQLW